MAFWEQLNPYEDADQTNEGLNSKEWLNFSDQPADADAVNNLFRDAETPDYAQKLAPRIMNGINWLDPITRWKIEKARSELGEVVGINNSTLPAPNWWNASKDEVSASERRFDFWRTAVTPNASEGSSLW